MVAEGDDLHAAPLPLRRRRMLRDSLLERCFPLPQGPQKLPQQLWEEEEEEAITFKARCAGRA